MTRQYAAASCMKSEKLDPENRALKGRIQSCSVQEHCTPGRFDFLNLGVQIEVENFFLFFRWDFKLLSWPHLSP